MDRGFDSAAGEGRGRGGEEGGWRAKGMPVVNRAAQDRAILRARDYKPLFPRRPLSQIYPSSTDTHPPSRPTRPSLCF